MKNLNWVESICDRKEIDVACLMNRERKTLYQENARPFFASFSKRKPHRYTHSAIDPDFDAHLLWKVRSRQEFSIEAKHNGGSRRGP